MQISKKDRETLCNQLYTLLYDQKLCNDNESDHDYSVKIITEELSNLLVEMKFFKQGGMFIAMNKLEEIIAEHISYGNYNKISMSKKFVKDLVENVLEDMSWVQY